MSDTENSDRIRPSVGRIVHYWYVNERRRTLEPLPLLITHVHEDDLVSGVVFDAMRPKSVNNTIRAGIGAGRIEGCWSWPERV